MSQLDGGTLDECVLSFWVGFVIIAGLPIMLPTAPCAVIPSAMVQKMKNKPSLLLCHPRPQLMLNIQFF